MSGYNEDWQRRKAYLIRSLFHDIPNRALSPVTEESTQSSRTSREDTTRSSGSQDPKEYYLSYEESEEITLLESTGSIEAPPPLRVSPAIEARSYSLLPPLIIERMPNKHDEPREFYRSLLVKMRKIYRKMFLQGQDYSNNDQYNTSVLNKESLSSNSNGYNADLETPDSYESNVLETIKADKPIDNTTIDLTENEKDVTSNDRKDMVHETGDYNEHSDIEMSEMVQESSGNGDPTYRQVTFAADIHIDGPPLPEVRPSPIYEKPQIEITPAPINKFWMKDKEARLPEQSSCDTTQTSRVSSINTTPILMYEDSFSEETQSSGCEEQQLELNKKPRIDSMQSKANGKPRLAVTEAQVSETHFGVTQVPMDEDSIISPILMYRSPHQRPKECKIDLKTAFEDNQALIRTQITADAKVVTEAPHCENANKSKQDSAFVLRFRRSGEHSLLVGRDSSMLGNNQDPDKSPSTEENSDHTTELEVMRTPRLDVSAESIPAGATRLSSHIDDNNNCEHDMAVENISSETSESQDSEHFGAVQQKVSGGIDDILATIFNSSQERDEKSSSFSNSEYSNARKRRFEEISVQTENVTWNNLRANFFVGTPKIFKLCSCVGHNCM